MKIKVLVFYGLLLITVAGNTQVDTNTINKWNDQALTLAYSNPGKALKIADKALEAARKTGFSRGEVRALIRKGIVFDIQSKNKEAIRAYEESLQLARKTNDTKAIASNLNNLGLIFWKDNHLSEALSAFNKAYAMFGKLGDQYYCASSANNIGLIYEEMRRSRRAIMWHRIGQQHAIKAEDKEMLCNIYSNIGNAYNTLNKYDSATYYISRAIQGYRNNDNKYGLGIALCNLGIIQSKTTDQSAAIASLLESIQIAKEIGNNYSFASSAYNLSNNYFRLKEIDKAQQILEEAYPIAQGLESNELSYKIAYNLAKASYKKGAIGKGDSYMSAYLKYHEKYFREVLDKNLIEAEKKIELKNERKLRFLERKEARLKIKRAEEARFTDNLLWGAGAVAVVFAFTLVFFIIRKRNLQQELINQRAVFAATMEERKRISYDLHDHVGSQLSYVVNNLELIQHQEKSNERIQRTYAMGQAAMSSLRDTVWALHSEELTVSALGERMENLVLKMFEQSPDVKIQFQIKVAPSTVIQQQHTMHVIRIFQEAVNNAFKHAQASRLEVELGETDKELYFTLRDNGVGISEKPEKPFHYGLQSMRERATKIGATLTIHRGSEDGVEVQLLWPKNNPIA